RKRPDRRRPRERRAPPVAGRRHRRRRSGRCRLVTHLRPPRRRADRLLGQQRSGAARRRNRGNDQPRARRSDGVLTKTETARSCCSKEPGDRAVGRAPLERVAVVLLEGAGRPRGWASPTGARRGRAARRSRQTARRAAVVPSADLVVGRALLERAAPRSCWRQTARSGASKPEYPATARHSAAASRHSEGPYSGIDGSLVVIAEPPILVLPRRRAVEADFRGVRPRFRDRAARSGVVGATRQVEMRARRIPRVGPSPGPVPCVESSGFSGALIVVRGAHLPWPTPRKFRFLHWTAGPSCSEPRAASARLRASSSPRLAATSSVFTSTGVRRCRKWRR